MWRAAWRCFRSEIPKWREGENAGQPCSDESGSNKNGSGAGHFILNDVAITELLNCEVSILTSLVTAQRTSPHNSNRSGFSFVVQGWFLVIGITFADQTTHVGEKVMATMIDKLWDCTQSCYRAENNRWKELLNILPHREGSKERFKNIAFNNLTSEG